MEYTTVKIKEGTCRKCGQSYGYEKDIVTNQAVNAYSDCICKFEVMEDDITDNHLQSVESIVNNRLKKGA